MVIVEDFTEKQCESLFRNMIKEFSNCRELDSVFDSDLIDPNLYFLRKNNRRSLGMCSAEHGDGTYKIYLNPNCLLFGEDGEKIIKDTLAHELCHTLKGCMNHGVNFHKWGGIINRALGYTIDTLADTNATQYFLKYAKPPYMLICNKCGNKNGVSRISDAVKNPYFYKCGKCGGELSSYKLNKDTNDYELYVSNDGNPKKSEQDKEYNTYIECPDCGFFNGYKKKTNQFMGFLSSILFRHSATCPKCGSKNLIVVADGEKYELNNK